MLINPPPFALITYRYHWRRPLTGINRWPSGVCWKAAFRVRQFSWQESLIFFRWLAGQRRSARRVGDKPPRELRFVERRNMRYINAT
jgi:hypothetical protein